MGRTKRTIRNLGLAGGAGVLAAALIAPSALAANATVPGTVDTVAGSASGQALDLSLLGRNVTVASSSVSGTVDSVLKSLNLSAEALGSGLSPTTHVKLLDKGDAQGCATAPLTALLNQINAAVPALAAALPSLKADVACGNASITGDITNFLAKGEGSVADVKVKLAPAVADLIGTVKNTLDSQILATPVGTVVNSANDTAKSALQTINTLLDQQLHLGVQLPVVDAKQTVGDLLNRLQDSDLVRISIGKSVAKNVGDAASFSSIAHDAAGRIEILPEFRGKGLPALVTIKIAESEAAVNVVRDTANATGSAKNTIVRIESELLPTLDLGKLGVAGVLPLSTLTNALGYNAGPGFIEIAPGQDLTLFAGTPLESSIAVSKVTKPEVLSNGHLKVTAAAASIHLFKGLNNLVPGVELGTILANPALDSALAPITSALGLNLGTATSIPGIKLDLAKAEAEAGAVKVTPTPVAPAVAGTQVTKLPRTGGPELVLPAAALLGGAGGLRVMMRRRRRA